MDKPESKKVEGDLDSDVDISWCDEYDGNPHLTDKKSIQAKFGKRHRPTRKQLNKEREEWEQLQAEMQQNKPKVQADPVPPSLELLLLCENLRNKVSVDDYKRIKATIDAHMGDIPSADRAGTSSEEDIRLLDSVGEVLEILKPFVEQHVCDLLRNAKASHLPRN